MPRSVTRVSSRGQVVIPSWARKRLSLAPGERLAVEVREGPDPAVVLRPLGTGEAEAVLERGYEWLERTGVDLVEALHGSRREARAREPRRR